WYRSQAVLGVLAWLVVLAGTQLLLRAVHRRPTAAEAVAALALSILPASSDALVESFHPQDLLSVGLSCAVLAQCLRRRWLAAGVLLGVAMLSKQFAVLVLIPAVASAPSARARLRVAGSALMVASAATAPLWLSDPTATWHALSATYAAGAGIIRSSTAIGLLGISEVLKLEVARDAPVLLSALMCLVVRWRLGKALFAPVPLVGLTLACLATRLVLEVAMYEYYFLAVGVFLLVLDLAVGRLPLPSLVWVVGTRYGVVPMASVAGPGWVAAAFLISSVVALGIGLGAVSSPPGRRAVDPVGRSCSDDELVALPAR
ncbi:MAG TPA: hypothetical protein VK386_06550, partial [Acidimicrobiales bacterium]|nr:hypothetical protein [Acidimicrobiales bacterium]